MSFQGTRYVWSLDVPMPLPPPPMPPTPPPPPPPHVAQFCCVKRRTTRKAARERANSDFMAWIIEEPGPLKPAVLALFMGFYKSVTSVSLSFFFTILFGNRCACILS